MERKILEKLTLKNIQWQGGDIKVIFYLKFKFNNFYYLSSMKYFFFRWRRFFDCSLHVYEDYSGDPPLEAVVSITPFSVIIWKHPTHTAPKNKLNLRIKPGLITTGADATVNVCFFPNMCKQKPNMYILYCCSRSSCDRLGFNAEIQKIFGTVCTPRI